MVDPGYLGVKPASLHLHQYWAAKNFIFKIVFLRGAHYTPLRAMSMKRFAFGSPTPPPLVRPARRPARRASTDRGGPGGTD